MRGPEALHQHNQTSPHEELSPKEKGDRAWMNLAQIIADRAHLENIPVDLFAFNMPIDVDGEEEGNTDSEVFVSSPILNSRGNIEIISLGLYQDGIHTQHWVTKLTWRQGKPKHVRIRTSLIDTDAKFFSAEEIARYAGNSINSVLPGIDYTGRQANGIFPLPSSYRLINH
jgi:hypothetical protein